MSVLRWGRWPTTEASFGERVRAMRIEANLSQDGLAALMPSRRHNSWVSAIEMGKQEPSLADLRALARVLGVTADWLLGSAETGDSELVARLRGLEAQMDDRGRREVLRVASAQVEEAASSAPEPLVARLREIAPEFGPLLDQLAARVAERTAAQAGTLAPDPEDTEEATPPPRRQDQAAQ